MFHYYDYASWFDYDAFGPHLTIFLLFEII